MPAYHLILPILWLSLATSVYAQGQDTLSEMMRHLVPWQANRDFTDEEWEAYRNAAQKLQGLDKDRALDELRVFYRFARQKNSDLKSERESIGYLVLRLAFAIKANDDLVLSKQWSGRPQGNVLWPLIVSEDGEVRLAAKYTGSRGPPHNLLGEFNDSVRKFDYRNLDEIRFLPMNREANRAGCGKK